MHITTFELRSLAICFIPVGVWLLLKGIRWTKKSFSGATVLDMPFTQQAAEFTITKEDNYAIW